jgi:hypothetical protein
MAESGLGGRFWFKAALAGKDTHKMLHTSSYSGIPHILAYMVSSKMFYASALLDAGHGFTSMRKGGRRVSTPKGRKKQPILDLSPIPAHGHSSFQRGKRCGQRTKHSLTRTCSLIAREVSSIRSKGIAQSAPSDIKWAPYNRLHTSNYTRVHYDTVSDVMVMRVNSSPNKFVRVTQKQYNLDMLDILKVAAAEHYAHLTAAPHRTLKALDPKINPDRPPKSYKDARITSNWRRQ